jgi:hypothetical protein
MRDAATSIERRELGGGRKAGLGPPFDMVRVVGACDEPGGPARHAQASTETLPGQFESVPMTEMAPAGLQGRQSEISEKVEEMPHA